MIFNAIETIIQWLGGLVAYFSWGILIIGIWKGTQRRIGLTTGRTGIWLRSRWFYLTASALFFYVCYLAWNPLPLEVTPFVRTVMLVFGSLLYFPGISFALWARKVMGKNYFVSTGLGAQLFADHQLITSGPFAVVRHPMYAGIFLASIGSLLIYHTWTTLLFTLFAPLLSFRALREEKALAMYFREKWKTYCQNVPAFIPRFIKMSPHR